MTLDLRIGRILGFVLIGMILVTGALFLLGMSRIVGGGYIIYLIPPEEEQAPAVFSHYSHVTVEGYSCIDCHTKLYRAERGFEKFTMDDMDEGYGCGACHDDDTAFTTDDDENCDRCHSLKLLGKFTHFLYRAGIFKGK